MRQTKLPKTYIPPEGGWAEGSWYVVNVSYFKGNPMHRSLFYTGFLDKNGDPAGYSTLVALNGPDRETKSWRHVLYLESLWLLCDGKGNPTKNLRCRYGETVDAGDLKSL